MTNTTALRDLPDGHDDESSPYWIRPEHRDLYQQLAMHPREQQAALDAYRRHLDTQDDLAIWQAAHDVAAVRDPESYSRWMKLYARPDGTPRLATVSALDGARPRGLDRKRELTADETLFAIFRAIRANAANSYEAERAEKRAARLAPPVPTCSSCGVQSEQLASIKGRGEPGVKERVCNACADLIELARKATASVPAGGTRAAAVAKWVGLEPGGDAVPPPAAGPFARVLSALR